MLTNVAGPKERKMKSTLELKPKYMVNSSQYTIRRDDKQAQIYSESANQTLAYSKTQKGPNILIRKSQEPKSKKFQNMLHHSQKSIQSTFNQIKKGI